MANTKTALTGPEIEICRTALEGVSEQISGDEIVKKTLANSKLAKYAFDHDVDVDLLREKLKNADKVDLDLLEKSIN